MTWALATIAALLIGYATVSRRLERLNVSGAMFFTSAGLLVAPVLGLLDLQVHGEQVKLLAEITLTLVLFADASRISLRALRHESAVPLRLLVPDPSVAPRDESGPRYFSKAPGAGPLSFLGSAVRQHRMQRNSADELRLLLVILI